MSEVRYDRAALRAPKVTENGRARFDGVFSRTGIFTYVNDDGSLRRELRPASEVFDPASLASLEMLPVVEDHPADGRIGNDHKRAQGWTVDGVRRDGENVVGSLLVTDPDLLAAMRGGKQELSVGYAVNYDATPGVDPVHGKYDGVQRNIRGDHLAVVDFGRAGRDARVRMDSSIDKRYEIRADGTAHAKSMPGSLTPGNHSHTLGDKHMTLEEIQKLKEAAADAQNRADASEAKNRGLESQLREQTARADAAEGKASAQAEHIVKLEAVRKDAEDVVVVKAQLASVTKQLTEQTQLRKDAESPERLAKAVKARVHIEGAARAILGDAFRADASDRDLMLVTVERVLGSVDKERSDDYLRARFDGAVESWSAGERAIAQVRNQREVDVENRLDSRTARQKMIDRNTGKKESK